MRYRVLPYKQGSKSAKRLAEALEGKVLKLKGSTFVPSDGDVIINWGNNNDYVDDEGDEWVCTIGCWLYNIPALVCDVTNKLTFFKEMVSRDLKHYIPKFWTNKEDINDEDFPIVCRTMLSGHSGAGIVIADTRHGLVDAQLYVKYEKKKDEYRIHLGRKSSDVIEIAVQRKARKLDIPDGEIDWRVRNLDGGFVYVRNGVNPPPSVLDAARRCFVGSGLDFGAVDVIWNATQEKAYVLEINTAPGLEGQTIEDYAEFFRGL